MRSPEFYKDPWSQAWSPLPRAFQEIPPKALDAELSSSSLSPGETTTTTFPCLSQNLLNHLLAQ